MVVGPASATLWTTVTRDPSTLPRSETRSAAAFCKATGSAVETRTVVFVEMITAPDAIPDAATIADAQTRALKRERDTINSPSLREQD